MNNFYLIDKPLEISSFDIIRILRKKLNISKMWHTWTLDPLATWGVLIAVWKYTKLIPYFEKDKKTYEFIVNIDWITDSFDLAEDVQYLEEKLQKKYKKEITKEKLEEILKAKFSWKIIQLPPKYSALKINWVRAYKLAREGKEVDIKKREVEIFNIELLDYNYPEITLKAEVSAGTYIRSIAMDLWEILWTWGYLTKLRRTKIWDLTMDLSQSLDTFNAEKSLDINKIFKNIDFITLEESVLKKINNWLKVYEKFDFEISKDLFVTNWQEVTNIVEYSWEYLFAKRKI